LALPLIRPWTPRSFLAFERLTELPSFQGGRGCRHQDVAFLDSLNSEAPLAVRRPETSRPVDAVSRYDEDVFFAPSLRTAAVGTNTPEARISPSLAGTALNAFISGRKNSSGFRISFTWTVAFAGLLPGEFPRSRRHYFASRNAATETIPFASSPTREFILADVEFDLQVI